MGKQFFYRSFQFEEIFKSDADQSQRAQGQACFHLIGSIWCLLNSDWLNLAIGPAEAWREEWLKYTRHLNYVKVM